MDKIFKYQQWHLLILIGLLSFLFIFTKSDSTVLEGNLWEVGTLYWYLLAISVPIIHQFYVLIIWRSELHFKSISKRFGHKGFKLYKIGFAFLFLARAITIIILAFPNTKTINIKPTFSYVLSALLLILSTYLFYSVAKYFGMDRAFGMDHFYPKKAKEWPFVNQGIFKYTPNAMYKYGFLILWIPGILLQSKAALSLALFNHLYIWVHFYFTELTDIKIIYGEDQR